jgi:hypothetical protein
MKVEIINVKGSWREIADRCNTTIGKDVGDKEPSICWKKQILLAEHSPIRTMVYTIRMTDIPYYVSVHLVRHKIGVEHFVRTQRTDRTGVTRDELPQGTLVTHEMEINLQALITISRKRLCAMADSVTRKLWNMIVKEIDIYDPVIGECLVPECLYRGTCTEFKGCGYSKSINFLQNLQIYRKKN